MPQISSFYGIIIYLYFNDHNPPHFHAVYSGNEVIVEIHTLTVLHGYLPKRALNLVIEWASIHQEELKDAWDALRNKQMPNKIEPLV